MTAPHRRAPRRAAIGLALGLAVLAAACRSSEPQPPDPAVDLPDTFLAAAQEDPEVAAAQHGRWWCRFEDERLDALVHEALLHNRDLHAAVARLDRAVAEARIAGADLWPSLGVGLDGTRRRQNFIGFPLGDGRTGVASTTFNQFGLGLDLRWEIDLWGRIRDQERAATEDLVAAQADLEAAYQSLAARTAKAWFAVVETRLQRSLAERTALAYRQTQRDLDDRVSTGLAAPADARLAAADLSAAEALLEERQGELEAATRQLEILLGRYPSGDTDASFELPSVPGAVPTGLPSELLERRPDLVAAQRRALAALARTDSARAALFPRLSLTSSLGTASEELSDLLDGDFRVWSLGANLIQPLFEGGRLRAAVKVEDARAREALADYARSVLDALSDVELALAIEAPLARREARLREAVAASRDALVLAEDRVRQGVEGLLTVLVARRRVLENESVLLRVRRARLDARIDLHLALGGGFEKPELAPLSAPSPSPRPENESES